MNWKRSLLAAALCAAGTSTATPAEDFARGSSVEMFAATAGVHTTGPFGFDRRDPAMSSGAVCFTKAPGSFNLDFDMTELGLPITVQLIGTPVGENQVRFTVDQTLNQCVTIQGADRRVKRVTGTITANLSNFVEPMPGTCAADFAQNLQVMGGPEGDTENQLHITVDSGCGDVTIGGDVVVHDITIDAVSGLAEPEFPVEVASMTLDRTVICPAPARDVRVRGELRLRNPAPRLGAIFTMNSNVTGVPITPDPLGFARGEFARRFTSTVPAGFLGTYTVTANGPGSVAASSNIVVADGFAVFGGACRFPKALLWRETFGDCLACNFKGRLRLRRPASTLARSSKGIAYRSAASAAGAAGYSTLEGKLEGILTDAHGTIVKRIADVQLFDMNDPGLAIGTFIDPQKQSHAPVHFKLGGQLAWLPSPSGYGEARVVNDAGAIGGWVLDTRNVQQAALWENGQLLSLHPQGALQSEVVSLSDDGLATVVATLPSGQVVSSTFDTVKRKLQSFKVPAGYDGVELVGATNEGLYAGHLMNKGARVPFIDFGVGVQLLNQLSTNGTTVDQLISLEADGALLVNATFKGDAKILLLEVK